MSHEALRRYGDVEVGEVIECGSVEVTKEEMLEFAERYDPQPFHLDEAAASDTMYGDLIASGWLTCSLTARLVFGNGLEDVAVVGARGVDQLRWLSPVYAGDRLSAVIEMTEKFKGDDPSFGHVIGESTTMNQHDVPVLTMSGQVFVSKGDGD